ncbi:ferredoxin [Streptomyces odonnellii]|uniref:ferredoxin n=1 Tax=Streptomyces odonnellii TaxID=1417980 RepID=UPI000626A9D1|nr:ferredoxin [Streptomyces odonnellii]
MTEKEGRIAADRSVCMGSGMCAYIAPDHFAVTDGLVDVLNAQVGASDTAVNEAVEACPTLALALRDQ